MNGTVRQGPHEERTFEQRLNMGTSRMEGGNWEKELLVTKGALGEESA